MMNPLTRRGSRWAAAAVAGLAALFGFAGTASAGQITGDCAKVTWVDQSGKATHATLNGVDVAPNGSVPAVPGSTYTIQWSGYGTNPGDPIVVLGPFPAATFTVPTNCAPATTVAAQITGTSDIPSTTVATGTPVTTVTPATPTTAGGSDLDLTYQEGLPETGLSDGMKLLVAGAFAFVSLGIILLLTRRKPAVG